MSIRSNISSLQFDIRKIADFAAQFPDCIRADIGEPDYRPPSEVYKILKNITPEEKFAYAPTFGLPKLLNALSEFEAKKSHNFSDPQFCVTTGAQAGLFSVFSALLDPGDQVLVHKAYYPPYKSICSILGAELIPVDLCDKEKVYGKISEKTKIILLNNPCNPTGEIFEKKVVENLANMAREKKLMIVSDDVYDRLIFKREDIAHASTFYPEGTLMVNSVSKTFCLTGARIGWILGESYLVSEIAKVHRNINSCPSSLMQSLVAEYLQNSDAFLERMQSEFQARGEKMAAIFQGLGWECNAPGGGMYLMPKIPELTAQSGVSSEDSPQKTTSAEVLVYRLIEQFGVSGVPGEMFGPENFDRIRFCFGALDEKKITLFGERLKRLSSDIFS